MFHQIPRKVEHGKREKRRAWPAGRVSLLKSSGFIDQNRKHSKMCQRPGDGPVKPWLDIAVLNVAESILFWRRIECCSRFHEIHPKWVRMFGTPKNSVRSPRSLARPGAPLRSVLVPFVSRCPSLLRSVRVLYPEKKPRGSTTRTWSVTWSRCETLGRWRWSLIRPATHDVPPRPT